MESRGSVSWLSNGDSGLVFLAGSEDITGRPPIPLRELGKGPRMAFSTRKIAARLVDGEIVLWP